MRFSWLAAASCLSAIGLGCTGPTYDTTPPFDADPPTVYVAKVKNILVGLPPTDAEIAAVEANPSALTGLVSGWMQLPQYQQKMQVFFELAFQQTQINVDDYVNLVPAGLPTGPSTTMLVQNSEESFARTALEATSQGQPLNSTFTTTTFMMTPALMQMYAFLDWRQTNDSAGTVDLFSKLKQTITLTDDASVTLDESLDPTGSDYLTFYNPAVSTQTYPLADAACEGIHEYSIPNANSVSLYEVFWGNLPSHTLGSGSAAVNCPITGTNNQVLSPADFTTWKLVTIRQPMTGEQPTQFWDLLTIRNSNELVLATPRIGFFSTPAFQANWPTNSSNQMRVTLNQALIVSTGMQVDGTDATTPGSTPGLDADHAAPGTACYGCHQLLDPTRSILSATYSWFYSPAFATDMNPETSQPWTSVTGLFAFQGVVQPVSTLDDFANILANHPLMPAAWAQKLCYYVNSAPCDPSDPEFQRIVSDFAKGFQWGTLVSELMTSPITTNAASTVTHGTNGEVIAVARRDHLCAALNNRLGLIDICQLDAADQAKPSTIGQIVSGMPSDGYGRGATIPVLPNQPTLFYRGGLENICLAVSALVIDAAPNSAQPNAKNWSSTEPDAAIADFVSQIMGLTSGDSRAAEANAALTAEYQSALAQKVTPTQALQSTFVTACLSPSFIGIGM